MNTLGRLLQSRTHGRPSARLDGIVSFLLCVVVVSASFADGPKAPLPPDLTGEPVESEPAKPNPERPYVARKGAKGRALHQFKDQKGVLVLTNLPDKYRHRKGFVEVSIKYSRVVVPEQYRTYTSASQYTTGAVEELVKRYSRMYALDAELVHAVIRAESNGDPYAVSRCGARGLMQLMPDTAAEMGVTNMFDPAQNIAGGTQYLAKMLNLFDNNLDLALAAYNAGPSTVVKYGGVPPYEETQQYVRLVKEFARGGDGRRATPRYRVISKKPKPDALPTPERKGYTIHFHSGYTQRVDKILDEDPYYYVQYGKRTSLVRKEHVAKVVGPV